MIILIIINGKFFPIPTIILHTFSICLFAVLRPPVGKGVTKVVEAIRRAWRGGGQRFHKSSRCQVHHPCTPIID